MGKLTDAWEKRKTENSSGTKNGEKTTSSPSSSSSKGKLTAAWEQRQLGEKITTVGVDTLANDISALNKSIEQAYNGWQTNETMRNTLSSVQSMYDRLGTYQELQQQYGGEDLTELRNVYKQAIDDWSKLSKKYKPYESAKDYQKAIDDYNKAIEEEEKIKKAHLPSLDFEIKTLDAALKKAKEHKSSVDKIKTQYQLYEKRVPGVNNYERFSPQIAEAEAKLNEYLKQTGYSSVEELEKALGEKQAYYSKAKWTQKGIEMSSVGDKTSKNYDKEFDEYSKYVAPEEKFFSFSTRNNPEEIYKFINDEDYRTDYASFVNGSADASLFTVGYEHMTDEEISLYNYYYNKHGAKKAEEYFKTILESVANRKAYRDFRRFEGETFQEASFGVIAGLDQFASGMRNLFNTSDDYIPVNATQQLSGLIREDMMFRHDTLGQGAYDLVTTTSNMLPSILASTAVGAINPALGTAVGSGLMGTSAAGNAYQEMLNLGYDKSQARVYSTLVGASEAGLQAAMGGISKLGGVSGKVAKAVSGIDNGLARFAIRYGGSMMAEGFEEAAQEVLNPLFKNIAAGYDTGEEVDWSEVAYSGLLGALSGGLLEGGPLAVNSIAEHSANKAIGADIKVNDRVSDVFDIASNPEMATAYEAYNRYAKKGITAENVSDAQLGRLYGMAYTEAQSTAKSKKSTTEQRDSAKATVESLETYLDRGTTTEFAEGIEGTITPERSKEVYKDFDAEDMSMLVESGLESAEGTEAYTLATEYDQKLKDGKKLSNKEMVKLEKALEKEIRAEEVGEVKAYLAEKGFETELAEVVTRKVRGEAITETEAEAIENSGIDIDTVEEAMVSEGKVAKVEETSEASREVTIPTEKAEELGLTPEVVNIVERKAEGKGLTISEAEKVINNEDALNVLAENGNEELVDYVKSISDPDKAKLFLSLYDGKTDLEEFAHSFELAVTKAEHNYTIADIRATRNVLSNEQISKIYAETRIRADQAKRTEFQKLVEKTAKMKAYKGVIDDSVIDYNNTSAEGKVNWNELKPRQREAITFMIGLAKATGMNLTLVTDGKAQGFNGKINVDRNIITMDIFAGIDIEQGKMLDTLIPTLSHELTHWMEKKSPVLFRKVSDIVFSTLKKHDGLTESERIANEVKRLTDKGFYKETDTDAQKEELARSEIVARACEDMLSRSEVGKELFNSLNEKEQKTLIDKIKDIIEDIKNWINDVLGLYKSTSNEATILREYQEECDGLLKLWDEMLRESVEVNQALEKSGEFGHKTSTDGDVLAQAREIDSEGNSYWQIETDKDIFKGIKSVKGLQRAAFNYILNGDKGNKIIDLIDGKRLEFIRVSAKEYVYGEASKDLTTEEYKQKMRMSTSIIDLVENASIQYDSPDHKNHKLFPNGFRNYQGRVGIDDTIFRYIVRIGKAKNGMIFYDINLEVDGRVPRANRTSPIKSSTSNDSIRNSERNVNTNFSDRDSSGRELSEGQQEYFKDSKVRDENGNLLVMYHGTPNAGFTKFRPGTYFTEHKWYADRYQNRSASSLSYKKTADNPDTYAVYLNIKKPFDTRNPEEARIFNEEYLGHYGMGTPLMESGLPDWLDGGDLQEFLEENGYDYDGLILDEGSVGGYGEDVVNRGLSYVTFKPEQVKSIDNLNPTDNEDIRFSMRENVEETKDLIAVHNMRVSELERTLDLGGLPMPSIAIIKAKSEHSEYGDVSLVFPKSTIDPKADKNNKVYGGDAWTPTYPTIEYKPNEKIADKISDKYYEFSRRFGYDESRPLYNYVYDMEDILNRHKGEAEMLAELYEDERMMQVYLLDSGKDKIETIQKEVRTELTDAEVEMNEYFINALGVDVIDAVMWDGNGTVMAHRRNYLSKYEDTIRETYKKLLSDVYQFSDEQVQNVLDSTKPADYLKFMRDAYKYRENGRVTTRTEADYEATTKAIKDAAGKDYRNWVDSLFKGIEEKSGIRNNVDYFTNSGNRRSWEALHWENNLENVVKVMKSQNDVGGGAFFTGHGIWGVSAKDYRSIEEIKADSDRLKQLPEEEYNKIKESFGERLQEIAHSIMDKSERNPFIASDNAMECIIDAIRNSKTKSGILNNLKQYKHLTVTETTVDDIVSLVSDIANMPTEYFEAKPKRAVELNEIATAIIPDNTSESTKTRLDDMGIKYVEYESGNEEARLEALNSLEDVRFSERDDTDIYDVMGEKERILKENEKFKAEIERLNERLKIERKVTNGNYFNEKQLGAVAGHLRNISKSNMDKVNLMKSLKGVYSFIANSEQLAWEDVFSKCYDIADAMLAEAKPMTVVDDYSKHLLKEIRNTRISLDDAQKAEAQYHFGKNWNRNFMGKVIISNDGTNIDSQWQEWSRLYPEIFSSDTNSADMISELYDIIDSLRTASVMIEEYGIEEQKRWLANEIYNQYWNVSPVRTTADKYNKRIKELNFAHRNAMKEYRDAYETRLKEQVVADDMYYGRKLAKEKEKHSKEIAEQKQRQKEMHRKLYRELRERKDNEIALAKQHGREMMDKYKDSAERRTKIRSITSVSLSLNEMLIKNSKDKHVPEIMKEPVATLLQAIDFSSKRMLAKGEPTKTDISLSKALGKVKDMMVKATNAHDELVELYGHGLDEDIEKMVDNVDSIMRSVGDNEFVLNRMSLEDLQTLDKMVKTIRHAVNALNKFHTVNHAKGIASLSQESVEYLDSLGKAKVFDGKKGAVKKLLNWGNALPYYAFKRYGSGGMKVYEALQDGWDKFAFNTKQILDYANGTYSSKEVKEWSKEVKTFKVLIPASEEDIVRDDYTPKYQVIQLTVPQIMSMYCLNKREQARGHLFKGGIRVADFKTNKGKIVSQAEGVIFTEKDISNILNSLTSRQKAVADKLQLFMNTVSTDWGNEVSMARFGYKAFGEMNYFPIQSDKNNLAVNDETEQNNSLFKLLNMSFTKSVVDNANNRIVISDIFDVFAQHTSDMAKYNALALPVLDAFKWYNFTEKQDVAEGTFKTKGVKQSIENAFGKDGQNYFVTFLKDINGQQEVSRDTLGKGFFSNAKIASVGANFRVVALQPTSYARASAVIDIKYLTKALGHKPKIDKAEKYCGIALWKSMGYYDTNIQRGVEAQIKHADTWKDKATEWSMKGAEMADKLTWGYLWNACELEIREKRRDLKVGSKEFYDAIGKRLREVIYATQVVDSTMTRSQMMRSSDGMDKMLTAFASEPTLSYNMLQDAYIEYSLDVRRMGKEEAIKKNAKRIGRIVFAYTMTNAVAALVESAFDAFREDDDEEKDMLAFLKLYFKNFALDMSVGNKIPYVKELYSILQGYSSSRLDTQWAQYLYSTLNAKKPSKKISYSIKLISQLSGLPFYNVYRDSMALLNKLDLFTEDDLNEMFGDFDD